MRTIERLNNYPTHESMRGYFGHELYKAMTQNPDMYLLTGDLGYGMLTPHQEDLDNFINCGAAETAMVGIAAGLAQEGKRPFTYTISSFYMRAAEPIALYIAKEQLSIIMIGSGRDGQYSHDGPSHHAGVTQEFMKLIGIKSYYPNEKEEMKDLVQELVKLNEPAFVSLCR